MEIGDFIFYPLEREVRRGTSPPANFSVGQFPFLSGFFLSTEREKPAKIENLSTCLGLAQSARKGFIEGRPIKAEALESFPIPRGRPRCCELHPKRARSCSLRALLMYSSRRPHPFGGARRSFRKECFPKAFVFCAHVLTPYCFCNRLNRFSQSRYLCPACGLSPPHKRTTRTGHPNKHRPDNQAPRFTFSSKNSIPGFFFRSCPGSPGPPFPTGR